MALSSLALVRAGLAAVAAVSLAVACGVPEIQNITADAGADARAGTGGTGAIVDVAKAATVLRAGGKWNT